MMSDKESDTDTDILLNMDPMGGLRRLTLEEEDKGKKRKEVNIKGEEDHQEKSDDLVLSGLSEWTESEEGEEEGFSPPRRRIQNAKDDEDDTPKGPADVGSSSFLTRGKVVDINLQEEGEWNIPPPPSQLQVRRDHHQGPQGQGEVRYMHGDGGSCAFINNKGDQVFIRAPNFRSGSKSEGSVSNKHSKESDDKTPSVKPFLTEAEMLEELRKMYRDESEEGQDNNDNDNGSNELSTSASKLTTQIEQALRNDVLNNSRPDDKPMVNFNFADSTKVSNSNNSPKFESSGGEIARPVSRKKLPASSKGKRRPLKSNAESISESISNTSSSSSSVSFTMSTRGMKRGGGGGGRSTARSSFSAEGFNFGGNETNDGPELSPINSADNQGPSTPYYPTPSSQLRDHRDQQRITSSSTSTFDPRSLFELREIWQDIQRSRAMLSLPTSSSEEITSSRTGGGGDNNNVNREPTSTSFQTFSKEPINRFESDLETLLNEADIKPGDFQEIVDGLDIGNCEVGGGGDQGEVGIEDIFANMNIIKGNRNSSQDHELLHHHESFFEIPENPETYLEKYHEEKFRRQTCEEEIDRLHKEILDIKESNAVLEGTNKRKDATIKKISEGWKNLLKDWKVYDDNSKQEITKLLNENSDLSSAFEQTKGRIEEYENQLTKTLELADNLKKKVGEVQESRDQEVSHLEGKIMELNGTIEEMRKNVAQITEEKNSTLRTLKESQVQITQFQTACSKLENDIKNLKSHDHQLSQNLAEALVQNSKLSEMLKQQSSANDELKNKVNQFSTEIESLKGEKEELRIEYGKTTERERQRLHEHYNAKFQEALKSNAENQIKTQALMKEEISRQARLEHEKKLGECKERYHADLMRMKTIYESEIQELRKENNQKELLIKTTAQQLRVGYNALCSPPSLTHHHQGTKDPSSSSTFVREQGQGDAPMSMMSAALSRNIPPTSRTHTPFSLISNPSNTNLRSKNPPNSGSAPQINMEYAKFVRNLNKPSCLVNHSTTILSQAENLNSVLQTTSGISTSTLSSNNSEFKTLFPFPIKLQADKAHPTSDDLPEKEKSSN